MIKQTSRLIVTFRIELFEKLDTLSYRHDITQISYHNVSILYSIVTKISLEFLFKMARSEIFPKVCMVCPIGFIVEYLSHKT